MSLPLFQCYISMGPSNTEEMLSFFVKPIDHQREDGTDILIEGDTVVMDNCGFYH